MAELTDKQLLKEWNELVENIRKQTAMLLNETEAEQKKRIKDLEADPEQWFKYYFPQYCYAEPADFHKEGTKRIIKNAEWYEVRNWSREMAKDARTMMEVLLLILTKRKTTVIMCSNSETVAAGFLAPYKLNLEANQRIIHDYGVQELPGKWTTENFTTRSGANFRALGAGQSPRGSRNEHRRPDVIIINDIDTDQDCRNADIMKERWQWLEKALIGTRSISEPTLIIFLGNIIAKTCCVLKAHSKADHVSIINIRNADGISNWPQKNTEEMIDRVLSKISYSAQQTEYFNNPTSEGNTFKELNYGKCPTDVQFVIVYCDPASSNKDRPNNKSEVQTSCKVVTVLSYKNGFYYVHKIWCDQVNNSVFVGWMYAAREYVKNTFEENIQCYFYNENNGFQNPFWEQVLLPIIRKTAAELKQTVLGVSPDDTDKPDKWARIEGTLEPLNTNGFLIFNEDEKSNPHMERTETQFKSAGANCKIMDAPDCVQGAVKMCDDKIVLIDDDAMRIIKRPRNKKRL